MTSAVRKYAREKLGLGLKAHDKTPSSKHQGLTKGDSRVIDACAKAVAEGRLSETKLAALCGTTKEAEMSKSATLHGGGIRVKAESEKYSSKKAVAKNKAGQPVLFRGQPLTEPSQLELVKTGVLVKHLARKSGLPELARVRFSEREEALLKEMKNADSWIEADEKGWDHAQPGRVKALLDDSTSGGQYLNPLWYDQNIITYPLLNGELFPLVDLVDMPRGRTINTAAIGNPTVTWGTAEGTALTAYNTASLVSQITGTVYPVAVALEIGRDLELDADPLDIGQALVQVVGQRFLTELDKVVAVGDGTTQPQGIFNASGTIAVNSDNGLSGPPTVSDLESLIFGIGKQYRQAPYKPVFVGSDTTYRRFSAIPVSGSDERRVMNSMYFGTEEAPKYSLYGHPFKVQNDIANNKAAFLPLLRYRMWRRMAFETTFTREGNYLATRNLILMVVRGRFAGKVVDGNAVATMTDLQS
jgi:HK97 family phage major capsid protein